MFSETIIWIIINIIVSILIIYSAHELWNFLKDTYSTRKTKDLVNSQIEKYKKMMIEIQENSSQTTGFIDDNEKQNMDNDLTEFMNQQLENI
jgi:hypothetical protein